LARAPTGGDEVAAGPTKPGKGDTGSMEENIGVSVQALTSDDAQDPRFRSVMQQGGGMVVTDVAPEGPAFQRLASVDDPGGPDIIVKVNGLATQTRAQFSEAMAKVKRGDIVTLQVLSADNSSSSGWSGRVVRLRAR
jgi:S1-C subfamily serine protease